MAARGVTWIAAALAAVMLFTSCGSDDPDEPARTPFATSTQARRTATTGPTSPATGDTVEIQGIVGSVDTAQRLIHVNVLQGADVETIELSTSTPIRDGNGRTLRLTDIRPSDRVIARGRVQGMLLVAAEVTVSQVVPGGEPGG